MSEQENPPTSSHPRAGAAAFWSAHRSWLRHLIGMLACVVLYVVCGAIGTAVHSPWAILLTGALFLAAAVGFFWFAVLLVMALWRMWRSHENSVGRYSKGERAVVARQDEAQSYWDGAKDLTRMLAVDQVPTAGAVWGVVLQQGEQMIIDAPADYARYYGTDSVYQHTSGFFFGSTSFVVAAYGANALANASRRRSAEQAAQTQWREIQQARVIVTDQRVLCQRADGRWLSFWYGGATAVYPEPENWNIVFDFPDTEPLMLHGPAAPYACVAAVYGIYGSDGVLNHPGLERLRSLSA